MKYWKLFRIYLFRRILTISLLFLLFDVALYLTHTCILFCILFRKKSWISATKSSFPMPTLILTFDQLFLASRTLTRNVLFISTISTNHCYSVMNLMLLNWVQIMTLVTRKWSSTTCISYPPKIKLIMITSPLHWQLFLLLHLKLFHKRIKMLYPIIRNIHISKTRMTIHLQPLPWQMQLPLNNFLITITSNFPPYSSNIYQFTIHYRHLTNQGPFIMNHLPFPHDSNTVITFLTLQFYPKFQLLSLFSIK